MALSFAVASAVGALAFPMNFLSIDPESGTLENTPLVVGSMLFTSTIALLHAQANRSTEELLMFDLGLVVAPALASWLGESFVFALSAGWKSRYSFSAGFRAWARRTLAWSLPLVSTMLLQHLVKPLNL
jgi:hypothetical protein